MMLKTGLSHVSLATNDMDATREFYENVLGFAAVRCDTYEVKEGGRLRHIFFDAGNGHLISFLEAQDVAIIAEEFDAGITDGLGVPNFFYHVSFHADTVEELKAQRQVLLDKGIDVTEIVDHGWCKSFYLDDPNGIQLEYCCITRPFNEDDARMQVRTELTHGELK